MACCRSLTLDGNSQEGSIGKFDHFLPISVLGGSYFMFKESCFLSYQIFQDKRITDRPHVLCNVLVFAGLVAK